MHNTRSKMEISYNVAFEKLIDVLNVLNVKTIKIHQIDFLIMYFPFYMLLDDLKSVGVQLSFDRTANNDDAIMQKMVKGDIQSISYDKKHEGTLNLALCEPVAFNDRGKNEFEKVNDIGSYCTFKSKQTPLKQDNKHIHISHLPFISFPPLFGVACANNPKINSIKNKVLAEKCGKLSRFDYWKHFSSNFSLLEKSDFKNLSASLYPKNSTTDSIIREKQKFEFKSKSWVKSISDEFRDMFHKHVDVAFTVQPWEAIEKSKEIENQIDIEIVYKSNVIQDYNCTSVIFAAPDDADMIIGNYVLGLIAILLNEKIKYLLHADRKQLKKWLEDYCKIVKINCSTSSRGSVCGCRCCKCEDNGNGNSERCTELGEIALEILADMNIYKTSIDNYINSKYYESTSKLISDYFRNLINDSGIDDKYMIIQDIFRKRSAHQMRNILINYYGNELEEIIKFTNVSLSSQLSLLLKKDDWCDYSGVIGKNGHATQDNDTYLDVELYNLRSNAIDHLVKLLNLYHMAENGININEFATTKFKNTKQTIYYDQMLAFDTHNCTDDVLVSNGDSNGVIKYLKICSSEIINVAINNYCSYYNTVRKKIAMTNAHIYAPHKIVYNFITERLENSINKYELDNRANSNIDLFKFETSFSESTNIAIMVLQIVGGNKLNNLKNIVVDNMYKYNKLFDYYVLSSYEDDRYISKPFGLIDNCNFGWELLNNNGIQGYIRSIESIIKLEDESIYFDKYKLPICINKNDNYHFLVFDYAKHNSKERRNNA